MSEDYNKIKLRVKSVEEAVELLTQMALRADERMDESDASLNNLTVKIEALVDAQIRIEETLSAKIGILSAKIEILSAKIEILADAQIRIEEILSAKVEALAAAQRRTDETLSAKIEVLASAQIRTEESLTRLAEAQAQTDKRLDALIDIVREDREGRNGK